MPILTASYQVEIKPGASWTSIAVLDVSGLIESNGNRENPLAFGDSSSLNVKVKIRRSLLASVPKEMPIRITFTIVNAGNTYTAKAFVGIVVTARRTLRGAAWALDCESIVVKLHKVRGDSPAFYQKPIAAKTTSSSPTSPTDPACSPLEWACLTAGGWPASRDFEYSAALFYYDFDQAILTPDWTWFNNEDAWEEMLKQVRATGGILYVGPDGVLRFRQPLGFGEGTPVHTFSDIGTASTTLTKYGDLQESTSSRKAVDQVTCSYVRRRALPLQQVAKDTTARFVEAGAVVSIPLELDYAVSSLETATSTTLKPEAIVAVFGDGGNVPQGGSGYTHGITQAAQRIVLTIQNATTRPFVIYQVTLKGTPIGPGASGRASAGSGANTLPIDESVYVQRESHATQIANIYLAFYSNGRTVYTLTDCPFDPRRTVGEVVYLTCSEFGLTNVRCLIVSIKHDKTGAVCDYDMAYVDDLPKNSDFFFVGTTNYSGQTKRLGW